MRKYCLLGHIPKTLFRVAAIRQYKGQAWAVPCRFDAPHCEPDTRHTAPHAPTPSTIAIRAVYRLDKACRVCYNKDLNKSVCEVV